MSPQVTNCTKCNSNPAFILLDKVTAECRTCFLESCNKKLRSTIGKSKLLRNNDSILIAHSGGQSSSALLDLIKNSIESQARREQKFRPSIIHIDTQLAVNQNINLKDRIENLETLLDATRSLYPDWPIYWASLDAVVSSHNEPIAYAKYNKSGDVSNFQHLLTNNDSVMKFQEVLEVLDDLTDREKFHQDSVINLIDGVANSINLSKSTDKSPSKDDIKFVFTASSATQLANNLLVNVILGFGSTSCSTVNVCDSRNLVPILRPMRDFSKKEISFYLRARNLKSSPKPTITTLADRNASIQKATESFLSKLYVDYPATYTTLLKTGNKLQD